MLVAKIERSERLVLQRKVMERGNSSWQKGHVSLALDYVQSGPALVSLALARIVRNQPIVTQKKPDQEYFFIHRDN